MGGKTPWVHTYYSIRRFPPWGKYPKPEFLQKCIGFTPRFLYMSRTMAVRENDPFYAHEELPGPEIVEHVIRESQPKKVAASLSKSSVLMKASLEGRSSVVKAILDLGSADPNERFQNGWTALMIAACNGHVDTVRVLLGKGAEVNAKGGNDWTALMIATWNGHKEIVDILIEANGDPSASDADGKTVLMWAAHKGSVEIVKALLQKGVDVEAKNKKGATAVYYASREGHEKVVDFLKKSGGQMDNEDASFMLGAAEGNLDLVRAMLENGVQINSKTLVGKTALMTAAGSGHAEIVEFLLEKGADFSIKDIFGKTALVTASQAGHDHIVQILSKAGARS